MGKHLLALQFAKALLCERRSADELACGQCHACTLFNGETHPDFINVESEEPTKSIGIDRIRQLLPTLALKPHSAGFRVVLINAADCLNNAAANAFLKCLEEPNERTVIILVAADIGRLPATIRSRCQHLKLTQPSRTQATEWLLQQQVQTDHAILLNMARGSPYLALQYAQDNLLALRNTCFDDWVRIAKQQTSPVATAEQWQKLPNEALLNWVMSWVVDLIKCHYRVSSPQLLNPDLQPLLQELQKQLDLTGLFGLYDLLLNTQKQLHTQLISSYCLKSF